MRAIIQRSLSASVHISGQLVASIEKGMVILLGIEEADEPEDVAWLSKKICAMRIFSDEEGKMNRSIEESGGGIIVVSQFTLYASTKKGNRPSFIRAARPDMAIPLYEKFNQAVETLTGQKVQTGIFGAEMQVALINDGPVTILIDSRQRE